MTRPALPLRPVARRRRTRSPRRTTCAPRARRARRRRAAPASSVRDALRDLLRRGLPDEAAARRARRPAAPAPRGCAARPPAAAGWTAPSPGPGRSSTRRWPPSARRWPATRRRRRPLRRGPARRAAALDRGRRRRSWPTTAGPAREAERIYREILDGLRRDVLDQQFRGLRDALAGLGPDAARAAAGGQPGAKDMLADLNELLGQARPRRGHRRPTSSEFMAQARRPVPRATRRTSTSSIDALARRAAAGERLMALADPAAARGAAGADGAGARRRRPGAQLAALSDNLRALRPDLAWNRGQRVRGERAAGLRRGGRRAAGARRPRRPDRPARPAAPRRDAGRRRRRGRRARARHAARRPTCGALQRARARAGAAGLAEPRRGRPAAAPKALRRLGQTALRQVFAHLGTRPRAASTTCATPARPGSRPAPSRAWEFGDEQPLDVVRTVGNAVRRRAGGSVREPAAAGAAVRLLAEDFEVVETERRATAAVALCVDLSFSMVIEGRWGPMKQTALALAHLVATRFPQDALQIIGFRRTPPAAVASSSWPASSRTTCRARTCSTRCCSPAGTCAGTRTRSPSSSS